MSHNVPLVGSSFCHRLLRHLQLSILLSEKNPFSYQFYESVKIVRALRIKQLESGSLMIHNFSMFRLYYEVYMGVVFLFCMYHFPLETVFREPAIRYVSHVLNVFHTMDIIFNFRTGFADMEVRVVYMQPKFVAKKYITSIYFLPDLLSTVPFFGLLVWSQYLFDMIVRGLTLFKLIRIVTCYFYIKRSLVYFNIYTTAAKAVWIILFLVLLCHWGACASLLVPQFKPHLRHEGIHHTRHILVSTDDSTSMYIHAFYHSSSYFLCVESKFSNFFEADNADFFFFLFIIFLVGKIIASIVTVLLVAKFLGLWSLEYRYYEFFEQLHGFLTSKAVNPVIRKRVVDYYQYKLRTTYFDEKNLRQEINFHVLQKFVSEVEILRLLPPLSLKRLVSYFQSEIFLPNDTIIKAGSPGDSMYFLYSGTVAVFTPSGKEVCHLQDGAYFGEISLLVGNQRRTAHVVAVETCEVYKLTRKAFNICLASEKLLMKKMSLIATERMETTRAFEDVYVRSMRTT